MIIVETQLIVFLLCHPEAAPQWLRRPSGRPGGCSPVTQTVLGTTAEQLPDGSDGPLNDRVVASLPFRRPSERLGSTQRCPPVE